MPVRSRLVLALLFWFSLVKSRPAAAQLSEERTPGLRVVYLDGTESYLVPHATRFHFSVLSALDLTLSLGTAIALEDEHTPRREAMISPKVLR